jgi:type IV pilus assembly protein PilC
MQNYKYRALNADARMMRGNLTAVNETDLYHRLKQAGLELLDAKVVKESKIAALFAKKVTTRDLVELCIHLEQLEKVGVPILDSLSDIKEATESVRLRDILADVVRDVGNGKLLSEALAEHPKVFNHVFVGLIATGEATGSMSEAFGHLVKHLKWADKMQRRLRQAMIYPAFMVVLTFASFISMMMFLVPQLSGFLKTLGIELPFMTIALIAVSDFVQDFWYVLVGLPIVLFVVARLLYATSENAAYAIDYYIYRLPLFGATMRKIALSRFSHFFAVMFQSGIGVLQCIDSAKRVISNRALGRSIGLVREMVEAGSSLTNALKVSGEFPNLVVRMVKIGEETGNLKDTLDNIAYFYDRDVEESVDGMIASIQPTLTMVIGVMMIWIILAVIVPVYSSFSGIG